MGSIFTDAPLFLFSAVYLKNVMKSSKSSSSNLEALKSLVESLSDRDVKIKRDINLFEEFFSSFPIPVTIWSLTKEGTVVSQRGNGLICENAKCIDTLFEEFASKEVCLDMHKKALAGHGQQRLVKSKEKMYYVSVVPRRDTSEIVSGVMGLAWDVTPNYEMLTSLETIVTKCSNQNPDLSGIADEANRALESSRLNKLLKSSEEGN